ncbi:membrane protein, partial [Mycobacterium sp. SWH-M1]
MTTAIGPTLGQRWKTWRWVLLAVAAVVAVATLSTWLTAPRPGGPLEAASTSPDGARALVTLLRNNGIDVVVAESLADVERAARPDTLLVAGQTFWLYDDDQLRRLAALPGDRLLLAPIGKTREALAPALSSGDATEFGGLAPDCDLREAQRAGPVTFGAAETFTAADSTAVTRCYGGVLARYDDAGRTVTVVGDSSFLTNGGLLEEGNAALAMNLAGTRTTVIWYAPQHGEGAGSAGDADIMDLIPDQVTWMVLQLVVAVALLALWRSRRVGPLVAEPLPVVVRASETVEGRGRLYRSRRARDRAADALRAAARQRLLPRLG